MMLFVCVRVVILSALLALAALPFAVKAHEVYLLSPSEVAEAIATAPFDHYQVVLENLNQFMFWAFIAILLVIVVFVASISHKLEVNIRPLLQKIHPYAVPLVRVTLGLALIACAYFKSAFGPELPLAEVYGSWADMIRIAFFVLGVLLTAGIYVRLASLAAFALFCVAAVQEWPYILTYTNYLGVIIVTFAVGTSAHTISGKRHQAADMLGLDAFFVPLAQRLAPYAFLILRVCFGVSLLVASIYAKILNNMLALAVATTSFAPHTTSLAQALGFEPHFLVLGAAIVEVVIALFFILGVEIRFTSLFLLFWLTLSLLYFGETVWPHLILIGIPLALVCYGYDRYSLEGWFFKKSKFKPVM